MKFLKDLLAKEKVKLSTYKTIGKVLEMANNQQEIKNVGKELMTLVNALQGDVVLVQYSNEKFHEVYAKGNKVTLESRLEDKAFFKKVKDTEKPFFKTQEDECFRAFPIFSKVLSKDVCVGVLCIYEEQDITCWEEIYTVLHMAALIFKHYDLIEENKLNNIKDPVTHLFNYRHFQDHLEIEILKADRFNDDLAMVLIDVEKFHVINEKLGYDGGDEVLRDIANVLDRATREIDMPARIGADTFAVLLSKTDLLGAFVLLNRLLTRLERHTFKVQGNTFKARIKLSATTFDVNTMNRESFIEEGKRGLKQWKLEEVAAIIEDLEKKKKETQEQAEKLLKGSKKPGNKKK